MQTAETKSESQLYREKVGWKNDKDTVELTRRLGKRDFKQRENKQSKENLDQLPNTCDIKNSSVFIF